MNSLSVLNKYIWNEIASILIIIILYIWHFDKFDGVPGWMKMS